MDGHKTDPTGASEWDKICPSGCKDAVIGTVTLAGDPDLYAIRLAGGQNSAFLPSSSVLVISPTMPIRSMDWVIFNQDERNGFARVLRIEDQIAYIQTFADQNEQRMPVDILQRVVWVALI